MMTSTKSNKIQKKRLQLQNIQLSDYLLNLDKISSKFKSLINCVSEIDFVHFNNKNIFSFNTNNISYWKERYFESESNKKRKNHNEKKDISKDQTMKYIILTRKQFLTKKLKEEFFDTKKIDNNQIDKIVQNLLLFEFLGFVEYKIQEGEKQFNYKLYTYYIGKDNNKESLKNLNNWKIINPSILDAFHFIYKTSWMKYLEINDINLTSSLYFNNSKNNLLHRINLFDNNFLKPEIFNKKENDEEEECKTIEFDARYILKRYKSKFNNQQPNTKKSLKRKREEEEIENENELRKKQKLNNEDYYSLKKGPYLSTEYDLITPEDFQFKNLIIPENCEFNINNFVDIIKNLLRTKESKETKINYDPSQILEILLIALNPRGVLEQTIYKIGKKYGLTVKNDSMYGSDIENKILEHPEEIRQYIFRHIYCLLAIHQDFKKKELNK